MKKYILFLCAIMALFCLFACGKQVSNGEGQPNSNVVEKAADAGNKQDKKIHIVTTIFPEYDWVKQIIGEENEHVDLTMLLDNGVDLHSYQPTAEDIMKVADCDLFIYVGGESDAWVEDALKEATNKDMKVINLLNVLGNSVKEEEVVEGMQEEEEHDHEEMDEDDSHKHEEIEYDEHVWLSLKNAQILCDVIEQAIAELDSTHADVYKRNVDSYKQQLQMLDTQYMDVVKNAERKVLVFGDRFPFRYLADDYDLSYYAAFVGCSAETEASFDTITFLAAKADELDVPAILTIEKSDQKIAQTIVENTEKKNQQILVMDSMQSTTLDDVTKGATYFNIMENNLQVLEEAVK